MPKQNGFSINIKGVNFKKYKEMYQTDISDKLSRAQLLFLSSSIYFEILNSFDLKTLITGSVMTVDIIKVRENLAQQEKLRQEQLDIRFAESALDCAELSDIDIFLSTIEEISSTSKDLIAELTKTLQLLGKNRALYDHFRTHDLPLLGRCASSAMIVSQIMVDYYTCLETLFHRISQFFGNGIDRSWWHKNLLANMTLEIAGKREAVIDETTAAALEEILRFRHFRRYYFDTEYDWDKIEFIEKKYLQAIERTHQNLLHFKEFLKKV